jgi:hypothetical protein
MITRTVLTVLALAATSPADPADPVRPGPDRLPFPEGEELVYQVRSSRFGKIGQAVMRVAGTDTVRGRETLVLSFDFSAKVLLFKVSDETRSWFDPVTRQSLRYTKRERSPLGDRDERVEILPEEGSWIGGDDTFELASDEPLDELSFLYFIRTLPLHAGEVYRVHRHFDARRNPVTITVVERSAVEADIGSEDGNVMIPTIVVEMRVPDSRQENGTNLIRLHLTDDDTRVPVRIETSMPFGGALLMTLSSRTVGNP